MLPSPLAASQFDVSVKLLNGELNHDHSDTSAGDAGAFFQLLKIPDQRLSRKRFFVSSRLASIKPSLGALAQWLPYPDLPRRPAR
jgi:hypothetical protein